MAQTLCSCAISFVIYQKYTKKYTHAALVAPGRLRMKMEYSMTSSNPQEPLDRIRPSVIRGPYASFFGVGGKTRRVCLVAGIPLQFRFVRRVSRIDLSGPPRSPFPRVKNGGLFRFQIKRDADGMPCKPSPGLKAIAARDDLRRKPAASQAVRPCGSSHPIGRVGGKLFFAPKGN
jgi:hypothetical protein